MSDTPSEQLSVNRRGLLLGVGVAALAAGSAVGERSAGAAPSPGTTPDSVSGAARHSGSPVTTSIASPPLSGYTYRSVCMYDFEPFDPQAQKTWGGSGVYSAGQMSTMRATVEIPPGALVRDVEFYVVNSSAAAKLAEAWLYVPGQGLITSLGSVDIPNTGAYSVSRATLVSTAWGPYPSGSRLLVGLTTPTDSSVQINGARVGFSHGAGGIGLFPAPQRVYNSTDTTKFRARETRTVTLPASTVPTGTTGVLLNVHVVSGVAGATLKVWPANVAEPSPATINVPDGPGIANTIVVPLSSARQLKIKSSRAAHVVVDLVGTVG